MRVQDNRWERTVSPRHFFQVKLKLMDMQKGGSYRPADLQETWCKRSSGQPNTELAQPPVKMSRTEALQGKVLPFRRTHGRPFSPTDEPGRIRGCPSRELESHNRRREPTPVWYVSMGDVDKNTRHLIRLFSVVDIAAHGPRLPKRLRNPLGAATFGS